MWLDLVYVLCHDADAFSVSQNNLTALLTDALHAYTETEGEWMDGRMIDR